MEITSTRPASRVPAWDARGLGPLPRQGVACVDMSDDGRFVAVGTIAPPGDANVLLLDAEGKLIGQHRAGLRWINEVTVSGDGGFVSALCTTPEGTAGDSPRLYGFVKGKEILQVSSRFRFADFRPGAGPGAPGFHYGDHSNHIPRVAGWAGEHWVVVGDDQVRWLSPKADTLAHVVHLGPGLTTAMAAGGNGRVAVGRVVALDGPAGAGAGGAPPSLIVAEPGQAKPVWVRGTVQDAAPAPPCEKGVYGPAVGPYEDAKVQAPLSVAVDDRGEMVASADYQGWRRQRAGPDGEEPAAMGLRFMPSRPAIHVHDARGKLVCSAGPEAFAEPFWADLAFTDGGPSGGKLLIWPHNWTSRGLGGQPILPADADARTLYVLTIATSAVQAVRFPDAISSVSASADGGTIAIGCWDGRVYVLDGRLNPIQGLPRPGAPGDVGAASLVKVSRDGSRIAVAGTDGTVRMLDGSGRELWRTDLNRAVAPSPKPWTGNQKADRLAPGLWRTNGGLAHSDMGSQFVVQAPIPGAPGLLIDPNSGASFEQNWARILGAGLDPMRVRFVLLTHEHGDHAPGAYLWRVVTGAQVVAGAEAAYVLQHHIPNGTGYGFHPPVPVDIALTEDKDLNLAGLKVRALRLPGHTYGSMGYVFQAGGRTCVATGDLVMPGGVLGYSGSMDFSAADVLASLKKLRALRPDQVLGGHGGGEPANFIDAGIEAGEATGWGKMKPDKPDPLYGFAKKNYLVVAWLLAIQSFACGDIDGDGRADLAVLTPARGGSAVRIYLNQGGRFGPAPDGEVRVAGIARGWKLRMAHLNDDKTADFLVSSQERAAALVSRGGKPDLTAEDAENAEVRSSKKKKDAERKGSKEKGLDYRVVPLGDIPRATQFLTGRFGDGRKTGLLIGQRFCAGYTLAVPTDDGTFRLRQAKGPERTYFDLALADVNGDGRGDLIASCGDVFLGQADGSLAEAPAYRLDPPAGESAGWAFMAAADFNNDGWTDVVLLANGKQGVLGRLYVNTRDPRRPLGGAPAVFTAAEASVLRDGPTVADWNGDGVPDLVLAGKDAHGACILLGDRADGLKADRCVTVRLDYKVHYDTKLAVADFNGDGLADLAAWGESATGAGGVYIWLQPHARPGPTGTGRATATSRP